MNLIRAFANYLEDELFLATLGTDMFIGSAPSGTENLEEVWWLVQQSGGVSRKNSTGEWSQTAEIYVYYRSMDAASVYDLLENLNRDLLGAGCLELVGYTVREVQTTGPFADQDLDNEERTVGVLQVSLTIYN